MKKTLISILCLGLVLFFSGCTITEQPQDATLAETPAENQDDGLSPDAEYLAAEKRLNEIFASKGKYKCELINDESDAYRKEVLFIDGENYRAYGYSNPKSLDVYKILGNVTSNVIGVRAESKGYCTYLWSIGVNDEKVITEKGMMGCKKNYNPPKPFEINDLVNGAFRGVSPELIMKCIAHNGVVDYSVPAEQEFVDFTEIGELGDAMAAANV